MRRGRVYIGEVYFFAKASLCEQDNNTAGEVCDTEDSQWENSNAGAEATPLVVTNKNREPESQTTGVISQFC